MFDAKGRNIHYLRLSVTDLCNLRCRYCMPDGVEKLEREDILTYEEFLRLAALFAQCGVDTVRVTGGEPLVRKGVDYLVARLKAIPGIRRVTMTTNGVLLAKQLPALLSAGLDSVNISLDTLSPEQFARITARDEFENVRAGIHAALESGLPVKLNCVPQVGVNEGELEALAALAQDKPLQVRFIEMMPIGYGAAMPCISGPELLARQLSALLNAGLDSVNISLDTLRPEVFQRITARDGFSHVMEGLRAALDSGIPVKLNCVPQAGVNEGELEDLAALAEAHPLQVRFIEMMPIGYGAAMPCISGPALRERFARRWPEFTPLPAAQSAVLGDGPAVYYTVPGWEGDVGFIAAVHGKFCASCNRVRLTSQGFLRPCLASEAGCDLRELLRSGATDAALSQAIRQTIWAKPREHHFGDNSMPATRGMYRIGG